MKLLRSQAAELANANAAELILFELSAASYLASPYPEEDRSKWIRILNERDLMLFGRSLIAKQLNQLENSGITAGAILPTTHGFRHLAEWAEKENIDVIIIPFSLVDPGLLERLRGYSLRQLLENTSRQVVVVDEDGTMWHANPESLTAGNQVA
jgi:PAS domain-containing protein